MKTPMADNASRSIVLHPWRLGAALLIVLVVLGRIALQLADVQLLDRKGYAQKANTEINRSILLTPSRGTIYDRMGNILALDVEEQSLYVEPQEIKPENAARLAVTLGAILDVPSEEVLAKLLDTSRRGVLVKRWLKPDVIQKITILNEKGVYLPYESHRAYPQGEFAAHVIGATNSTGMGIAGVEANFDDFLRGTTGVITTEVDGDGVPIWSRQYTKIAPKNGNVLILTIDSYIQHMVEVALSQAIEQHGATGGSAIVLDVKTGAVLAMASYPDFDPNNYADVDPAVYNINPAVGAVYEPGSTFKMVTVAAGLQAKAFDEKTQVEDNGTIRRFEETLANYDQKGHGMITPAEVLYYSSNIGALLFAELMGESVFNQTIDAFGFGKLTGIELPGETAGIYWKPGTSGYTAINLDTNSYGQGIAVTPLQIARMTATIANNGVMMRPYIIQSRCRNGECVNTVPREQGRPIDADVANRVRQMVMKSANHYVNVNQPDTNWLIPGYKVGAKTGTSSIPGEQVYTNQTIGSVAGMAPIDAPRYAVLVKIDRPQDDQFGVRTALPVYRQIMIKLMRYDRIAPDNALVGENQHPGMINGE